MSESMPVLTLTSYAGQLERRGEPVVIGVPLARNSVQDARLLHLLDFNGRRVPCDATVLDRWPDGSARWALLAFRAHCKERQTVFKIGIGESSDAPDAPELTVISDGKGYVVDTGKAAFKIAAGGKWPICGIDCKGKLQPADAAESGLFIQMPDGSRPPCVTREIDIEYKGKERVALRCRGTALPGNGKRIEIDWRIEFFAGSSAVILQLTIRNPHRAAHPEGFWELGDSGSLLLKEASFKLKTIGSRPGGSLWASLETGKPFQLTSSPFSLYQGSSGGENWQSKNHINREGHIPAAFRGYTLSDGGQPNGFRAAPIVAMDYPGGRLTLAPRRFWQNFPKFLEASDSEINYGLFPSQWNDLHELQGGEQKTHTFALSFGDDEITETPLEWFREPLVPSLNPGWVADTGAVPYFAPESLYPQYLELINDIIEGNDTFEQKREKIDEYGWRHFGDIYGDHEAVYAKELLGTGPLISHYNNQYDPVAGFCYQWLRSGDPRWWSQFHDLAAHVVDIDIYHTQEDKAAYNNGLFWHTFHYIEAGKANHRSYPRIGKSQGGGPSNEHVYASGLRMHYLLTGDTASREAAIGLAQFIINIDDGSKTVFRWFARGETGLASHSGSPLYHGPGRGSGNATSALIDGYLLTGDRRYLEKAEQLIRRVIHPHQNIDSLNLKDIERKWFYTMFLQSLGRYLDLKMEIGELDEHYGYGRLSLLHFARWMAENEYLYLERPEILEYPTETWPAQDLRKASVFDFAAKYSDPKEKKLFQERAEYFYCQALEMLSQHETRTLARPMVLLLTQGFAHAWFRKNNSVSAPLASASEEEIGSLENFIPQKVRAIKNAKRIIFACGILGAAAISILLWYLLA